MSAPADRDEIDDGRDARASRPLFTVIICTLNRPAYLRKALAGLAEQTLPADLFDVMVVDNGPDAATRKVVVEEFASTPNLLYVEEPETGLSVARRTGWRQAAGRYVAYLDDDAIPAAEWLEGLREGMEMSGHESGIAGGPIDVIWEAPRPDWLPAALEANLGFLDLGPALRTLQDGEVVFGGNMALPLAVLQETDAFSEGLGRKGSSLMSNEETLLQNQLDSRGYSRVYSPKARIHHHAPASRLTKSWFWRRAYAQGYSSALEARLTSGDPGRTRPKTAVLRLKALASNPAKLWRAAAHSNDPAAFQDRYAVGFALGYSRGLITKTSPNS